MSYQYDPKSPNRIKIVHDGVGDCGCAWPLKPLREGEKRTNETMLPAGRRTCGCIGRAVK